MEYLSGSLFYNLSQGLFAIALLLISDKTLRTIFLCAFFLAILAGYYANNYSMIIWSLIFCLINLISLIRIYLSTVKVKLPKLLNEIYNRTFYVMTTRDFLHFWNIGEDIVFNAGDIICEQEVYINKIYFILEGKVSVELNGKKVAEISNNHFIGEMSYWLKTKTTAKVVARTKITARCWQRSKIYKLKKNYANIYENFKNILGTDMIDKICKN